MSKELNSELDKKLLDSIDKVTEWVKHAEDFAVEQTPLLIEEILTYNLWFNVVGLSFLILIILFLAISVASLGRNGKIDFHDEEKFLITLYSVIATSAAVCLSGLVLPTMNVILKITFAPRLYILEYLQNLL